MNELSLASALLVGLMSSSHCLAMCGGVAALLSSPTRDAATGPRWSLLLGYNLGRVLMYGLLGALFGLLGAQLLVSMPQLTIGLRLFAGLMLVAMGLYVTRWWMGLTALEKAGALLWQRLQPLSRSLLPVRSPATALGLGMLWGLMPCGLVYSSLSWSMAAGSWQQAALLMMAFGLGTLPATLLSGVISARVLAWLRRRDVRVLAGMLIIALGLVTLYFAVASMQHNVHPAMEHGGVHVHADPQ